MDSFYGSRSASDQRSIIETFSYMAFKGRIRMTKPDNHFRIFEEYVLDGKIPHHLYFGRLVAESGRKAMNKYTLKKRNYIATTSMDAELSLVTANLAQAGPGKLAYDPFMGTGSFPVACAHFGAAVFGSDLDGRSIRGKGSRNVRSNFEQYGTAAQYLGGLVADLTNSPLRDERVLSSIVCDPPYGVREGLKVLGSTRVALKEVVYLTDGKAAHLQPNYVPPKKPYSFMRLLDDILDFSADRLTDDGRLCMWMPVAGVVEGEDPAAEEDAVPDTEYTIPRHPALELVTLCKQDFNKWSRRLLTYRRLNDRSVNVEQLLAYKAQRLILAEESQDGAKMRADDLNAFRRKVHTIYVVCLCWLIRKLTVLPVLPRLQRASNRCIVSRRYDPVCCRAGPAHVLPQGVPALFLACIAMLWTSTLPGRARWEGIRTICFHLMEQILRKRRLSTMGSITFA